VAGLYYIGMAKLTEKQVKHVAALSRLQLTNSEVKNFQTELSQIINHFSELNEVNVNDIGPMSHPTGLTDILADDNTNPISSLTVKKALNGTNNIYNNYFVVPQLIDKED